MRHTPAAARHQTDPAPRSLTHTRLLCSLHSILGFHGTLLAEPVALLVGLSIAIFHPGLLSIAILDGMRKILHYSLVKPTKEGLYAALSKVRTLLPTACPPAELGVKSPCVS